MRTALVKAIALPAVYRANLEFQSHVPVQHSCTRFQGFAHARTPRVLHFSAFIISAGNCSKLPDLSNGRVIFTGLLEGYNALYICDDENHTVIGDRVRTCMSNGMWSGQEPTCEGMKSVFVMTYIIIWNIHAH